MIQLRHKKTAQAIVLSQLHHLGRLREETSLAMGVGAVNPSFFVPSAMTPTAASSELQNAVNALLVAYSSSGVPSEHSASPEALAVQTAWDNDPIVIAAGSGAKLDKDESYGPNTHDAVAAVNGGSAPDVNTGSKGSTVSTSVTVNTSNSTSSTTTTKDWTRPLLLGVAVLAVGGVATAAIVAHDKKRKARRRPYDSRPTMPHGHRPAYT